jgi:WbqC-like protein family
LKALIDLHYLPCIAYFAVIQRFKTICLEKHEHFVKQSYRNRCYINTEHGKDVLVIPLTDKHGKVAVKDIRIDYTQKWVNNHWRSICSAYGKAPFFEYYAGDLESNLFKQHTFLYELNYELLTMCLKWLKLEVIIEETLSYEKNINPEKTDLRSRINAKDQEYINLVIQERGYQQVFGNAFVANLSIIDAIFCCGPEAGSIIKASFTGNEQIPF